MLQLEPGAVLMQAGVGSAFVPAQHRHAPHPAVPTELFGELQRA